MNYKRKKSSIRKNRRYDFWNSYGGEKSKRQWQEVRKEKQKFKSDVLSNQVTWLN